MSHDHVIRLLTVEAPRLVALTAPRALQETIPLKKRAKNHQGNEDDEPLNDLYLVFEYVDTDLQKLIGSRQYLSIMHVKTFLYQLLLAVKYTHSANVIHRDIKPANILLYENCVLKLCDFGLARITEDSSSISDHMNSANIADATLGSSRPVHLTRSLTQHVVTRFYLIVIFQYMFVNFISVNKDGIEHLS